MTDGTTHWYGCFVERKHGKCAERLAEDVGALGRRVEELERWQRLPCECHKPAAQGQGCGGACVCGWRCGVPTRRQRTLTVNLDGTPHSCDDHEHTPPDEDESWAVKHPHRAWIDNTDGECLHPDHAESKWPSGSDERIGKRPPAPEEIHGPGPLIKMHFGDDWCAHCNQKPRPATPPAQEKWPLDDPCTPTAIVAGCSRHAPPTAQEPDEDESWAVKHMPHAPEWWECGTDGCSDVSGLHWAICKEIKPPAQEPKKGRVLKAAEAKLAEAEKAYQDCDEGWLQRYSTQADTLARVEALVRESEDMGSNLVLVTELRDALAPPREGEEVTTWPSDYDKADRVIEELQEKAERYRKALEEIATMGEDVIREMGANTAREALGEK